MSDAPRSGRGPLAGATPLEEAGATPLEEATSNISTTTSQTPKYKPSKGDKCICCVVNDERKYCGLRCEKYVRKTRKGNGAGVWSSLRFVEDHVDGKWWKNGTNSNSRRVIEFEKAPDKERAWEELYNLLKEQSSGSDATPGVADASSSSSSSSSSSFDPTLTSGNTSGDSMPEDAPKPKRQKKKRIHGYLSSADHYIVLWPRDRYPYDCDLLERFKGKLAMQENLKFSVPDYDYFQLVKHEKKSSGRHTSVKFTNSCPYKCSTGDCQQPVSSGCAHSLRSRDDEEKIRTKQLLQNADLLEIAVEFGYSFHLRASQYKTSATGMLEQAEKRALKILYAQCDEKVEDILVGIDEAWEFQMEDRLLSVKEDVKSRIKDEWDVKIRSGVDSKEGVRDVSLESFIEKAVQYGNVLKRAKATQDYRRWRVSLYMYKDAVKALLQNPYSSSSSLSSSFSSSSTTSSPTNSLPLSSDFSPPRSYSPHAPYPPHAPFYTSLTNSLDPIFNPYPSPPFSFHSSTSSAVDANISQLQERLVGYGINAASDAWLKPLYWKKKGTVFVDS